MSEVTQMKDVSEKVRSGERLNQEEGLYLLEEAPLLELGSLAQEVRFRHNPESRSDVCRRHQPKLHQRM